MYNRAYFEQRYGRYADPRFMEFSARLSRIKFPAKITEKVLVEGAGYGVDIWGRLNAVGIDSSKYAVKFCREHAMMVRRMDAEKIKYHDGVFDAVICSHLLEHVDSPQKVIREARRVLRKGGLLYVALPETYADQGGREDGHLYVWSPDVLRNLLERAGFEVLWVKRFNYRAKFVACHFPFWIGRMLSAAAGLLLSGREEFAVCAQKNGTQKKVEDVYNGLISFYGKHKIPPERSSRTKEMAVRYYGPLTTYINMPRTKNPMILVHAFQHATLRVVPIIKELLLQRYNVVVLAEDLRAKKILEKSRIRSVQLSDYKSMPDEPRDLKSRVYVSLKQAAAMLDKERPNLVLTMIDNFCVGRCLVTEANERGVPSLLLQHGLKPMEDLPFACKHVAVWGPHFKKQLEGAGVPKGSIHVAGFVGTDEILTYGRNPKGIVTYFTQGQIFTDDERRRMLERAAAYAESKRMLLVVVPHPAEDSKLYKSFSVRHRHVKMARPDYPVYRLMSESDETMTVSSTTSLESVIMGVPCVSVKTLEPMEYDLEETVYKLDNKAAKRIVKLIGELVAKK